MLKNSLLSFKKYTKVRLEKSSMKVNKYLQPEKETTGSGPHKSLCTSCKGDEACQEARLLKLSLLSILETALSCERPVPRTS